jgi:DNA-binding FadR family transcriptional regulator
LAADPSLDQASGETRLARWPRRPQRLATAVVSDLTERIVFGEFAPGTPLPGEPVLVERFGVSRITVREAVKALESMRLVEVRQGTGTSVRARKEWNLLDQTVLAALISQDDDLDILDEIIALRCQLEGTMASRAADRLDDAQRATLSGLLAQLEKATDDPDQHTDLDVTFHDVIMNASDAPLSQAIIATLNTGAYGSSPYIGKPTNADRERANTGHRKILQALISRDGEAARQAMSDHIYEGWLRRRPKAAR